MGDFEIDGDLIKFNDSVPPAIGSMQSAANDIVDKTDNAANISQSCMGEMAGAYQTDSTGQVIIPFEVLMEGLQKISEQMKATVIGAILPQCAQLGEMIEELLQIVEKAQALYDRIQSIKDEINRLQNDKDEDGNVRNPGRITELQQELKEKEQEFEDLKAEFKEKHEAAKSTLDALKGADATMPEVQPTNGSLGYDPSYSLSAKQGSSTNSQLYQYQVADQSITRLQS